MNILFLSFLILFAPSTATTSPGGFSRDSACAILRTLSVDIGPRPMGSPAEQRAMQFAVDKFREYGCQQAYVMPMTVARGVNTKSGVAIGVLKGKTDRIIVIGGHIDSAGPDIPGANDDGSGVACVVELARVLSKNQHESTIMFCCWGGEEHGLEGSNYFVNNFEKLDSVVLMLQIDMADGTGILEIDPDYGGINAPRWLTSAAYDVFYNELHSSGLVYPVASAVLNAATGGSTGSDHDSFLEKGIPAIDFTSDVDYPIHTPQDNLANFNPSGLKKTGDLVLKLMERFDGGVPSRATGRYMLVQLGTMPVFVPHWVLWIVIVCIILLAVVSVLALRRRRMVTDETLQIRWSSAKLILFALIIQVFVWMSESVMGLVRGYRFPWVDSFGRYAVLGMLFGLIGLWIVLRLIRRYPLTSHAHVFGWWSVLILSLFTLLTALLTPELAIFFGLALAIMSLALLIRHSIVRVALWILSCLIAVRLVFFEELGLIQRSLTENQIHSFGGMIGYESFFIVLFTILSLPFVFGFVAIRRDSKVDLFWLKRYRSNWGLVPIIVMTASVFVYLLTQPVYNDKWYNTIRVEQRYTLGADSSTIEVRGSENLDGTQMILNNVATIFSDRTNYHQLAKERPPIVQWLIVDRARDSISRASDTMTTVRRETRLCSQFRPYTVVVSYKSTMPLTVESTWSHGGSRQYGTESEFHKFFAWYSFPDTDLTVPITFRLKKDQQVVETIEVKYDSLAYDLRLSRGYTNIMYRTVVVAVDTFSAATIGGRADN